MFHVLLVVLFMCCSDLLLARHVVSGGAACDDNQFLCSSNNCPQMPPGVRVPDPGDPAVCSLEPETGACICWMNNPSSHIHTFFQCDARINNTFRKLACIPPSHCYNPQPTLTCMIVLRCPCLVYDPSPEPVWKKVKALVHTRNKSEIKDFDVTQLDTIENDVREFSLKHLFFLVGFVVTPLICWCLLNFFHEGKCRKRPALQFRGQCCNSAPPTVPCAPTAPCEEELAPDSVGAPDQALLGVKCESPPPYNETVDGSYSISGPPPAYEEAMRDPEAQQWQTIFILHPPRDAT